MTAFAELTVALLVAHAVGDFVLQRRRVIDGKRARAAAAYLEHGAVHLLALLIAWLLFAPLPLASWQAAAALTAIVLTHLMADWIKETTGPNGGPWTGATAYLFDQAFHLGVIVLVSVWLAGPAESVAGVVAYWNTVRTDAAVLLAGYLLIVFGAGYLNGMLLQHLAPSRGSAEQRPGQPALPAALPANQPNRADGTDGSQAAAATVDVGVSLGLGNAGLYIGWLERFLMLTAVLLQSPAALGLIVAAKSIFRFDDIRQGRASTEYFLIGTLLSGSQAIAGGLAMHWLLQQLGA
jgi:hypothetical protein